MNNILFLFFFFLKNERLLYTLIGETTSSSTAKNKSHKWARHMGNTKMIWHRIRRRHMLITQGNETQVETMRAELAIKQEAEEWLRAAGEGNEQSGTWQTITGTGSAGKQRTPETRTSK